MILKRIALTVLKYNKKNNASRCHVKCSDSKLNFSSKRTNSCCIMLQLKIFDYAEEMTKQLSSF